MSQNFCESVLNVNDTNTIITLNPASQLPTKLTGDNFPTWRAQLFTLLRGLDLLKFLDGSHPAPAATAEASVRTLWFRQDQLLLHAIHASISPSVAPYVSAATSSQEAWTTLERRFASQSRQRVIHLKQKLGRETLGNRPVAVYLQVMSTTAAELDLINAPVSNEDLILYVLRGLPEAYDHLLAAIRARDTPIRFEDLHDRLVDFETDLASVRLSPQSTPTTAFSSARGYPGSFGSFSRGQPGHRWLLSCPSQLYGFGLMPSKLQLILLIAFRLPLFMAPHHTFLSLMNRLIIISCMFLVVLVTHGYVRIPLTN
ncbi:unnamed protein product [Linum tenue]|uniref:Retrotransposon Copia-like N-terminal domain-containing protein n=1 Tax=Linum tenue TaxID=586396 RepID=A0AAV0R1S0_9ROSI|nr:unnamed protein product [Linum tenue]